MTDSDYQNPTLIPASTSINGALTVQASSSTGDSITYIELGVPTANHYASFATDSNGIIYFDVNGAPAWSAPSGSMRIFVPFTVIANIVAVGLGVPAERGIVSQAAVTTSTSTTTTVYAVPTGTANRVYRLSARIFGNSGTVTSGVYEIKWTEGGFAITKDLSISAVDTDTDLSILIQPDQTTNITSQLKTLTGGGTVNIACLVEGVDTGT